MPGAKYAAWGRLAQQLVDAVGRHVGSSVRLDAEGEGGVGAVDDGLEQHAAGPEPGVAVGAPAPDPLVRVGRAERAEHGGDAIGQPPGSAALLGRPGRGDGASRATPWRRARPTSGTACHVVHHVRHGPAGTGRHRRGLVRVGQELDQAGRVGLQPSQWSCGSSAGTYPRRCGAPGHLISGP